LEASEPLVNGLEEDGMAATTMRAPSNPAEKKGDPLVAVKEIDGMPAAY